MSKAMDRLVSVRVFQEDVNALRVPRPNPWYVQDRAALSVGGFGTGGIAYSPGVSDHTFDASPGFGTGGTVSGDLPDFTPLDVSPGFGTGGSIDTI